MDTYFLEIRMAIPKIPDWYLTVAVAAVLTAASVVIWILLSRGP
jgi:hypothetical protein